MEFSPIVIQRKAAAPPGGSSNPFDDFDFIVQPGTITTTTITAAAQTAVQPHQQQGSIITSKAAVDLDWLVASQPGTMVYASSSPKNNNWVDFGRFARGESLTSADDDPFNLFGSDGDRSAASPKASPAVGQVRKRASSKLRNEIILGDDGPDPEDQAQEVGEDVNSSSVYRLQQEMGQTEPTIPFSKDDAELSSFLLKPLEPGQILRLTVLWDEVNRMFKLIHESSRRIVLTAMKRTDGFKALSLSANYSIFMLPTDESFARASGGYSPAAGSLEPLRIAKLRGNTLGSQFSLFDNGKNPHHGAKGILEARRELMSVRFELVPGVDTRRATFCYLPAPGHHTRPTSRNEMLEEKAKRHESTVVTLVPYIPGTSMLPRVENTQALGAIPSVKNILLHDIKSKEVCLQFGRQPDRHSYRLEFTHPFSATTAFAVALASCDSKIHPSRPF